MADWLNAVGTLLAFGAATVAAMAALRSYRAQLAALEADVTRLREENARREAQDRRAQAATVAVWAFQGQSGWCVDLVNDSGLPVHDLAVRFRFGSAVHVAQRGTQGPTPARRSDQLTDELRRFVAGLPAATVGAGGPALDVAFTDAAGLRWHRQPCGRLTEVAPGSSIPATKHGDGEAPARPD